MLLSGLRTGGVRPTAGPTMPQTAAIGGSFQPPRFASPHQQPALFEENIDDMNPYANLSYGMPMTAAIDGRAPRFQQQQQLQFLQHQARLAVLNGNNGMNGMMNPIDPAQAQFMQLQLMQAMVAQQQQAQKLQAELAMQQQVAMALSGQRQQVQNNRVASTGSRMPSTAGPMQTSFDASSMSRMRSEQMGSVDETSEFGAPPMTAALGGKFGSRTGTTGLNPNAPTFRLNEEVPPVPATPSSTVVISGGVSLGAPSTPNPALSSGPSKSDAAVSWRRGSNAASTVFARSGSPPKMLGRQSPPTAASPEPVARESPTLGGGPAKYRPQPLRIRENQAMLPSVTIENEQGMSVYSSTKMPSPTSSNSSGDSHRKYEAPPKTPLVAYNGSSVRHSQPVRQPRGPPAGVEEVSSLNFASRVKRVVTGPMVIRHEPGFVEAY